MFTLTCVLGCGNELAATPESVGSANVVIDELRRLLLLNGAVLVVILLGLSLIAFLIRHNVGESGPAPNRHGHKRGTALPKLPVGAGLLGRAAKLLPGVEAARYAEEWQAELNELSDASWWRRLCYALGIVFLAVPPLVLILRLRTRGAPE